MVDTFLGGPQQSQAPAYDFTGGIPNQMQSSPYVQNVNMGNIGTPSTGDTSGGFWDFLNFGDDTPDTSIGGDGMSFTNKVGLGLGAAQTFLGYQNNKRNLKQNKRELALKRDLFNFKREQYDNRQAAGAASVAASKQRVV